MRPLVQPVSETGTEYAEARDRWHDNVESVRGVAAVPRRIGQRREHPRELDRRARPAVQEEQRQRALDVAASVQEMDGLAIDRRDRLRDGVQGRLLGAPIEVARPIAREALQVVQWRAAAPASVGGSGVGPPCSRQAIAQVGELRIGDRDAEGREGRRFGGHRCRPRSGR